MHLYCQETYLIRIFFFIRGFFCNIPLLQTSYVGYIGPKNYYFFKILTKSLFRLYFMKNGVFFTIKVPEKNALLGSCHQFQ